MNTKLTPDDLRKWANKCCLNEGAHICADAWQADKDALAKAEARVADEICDLNSLLVKADAREQELLSIIRDLDDAVYEDLIIGRIKPSTDEADNRVYIYSEAQHEAYKEAFKDEP